MSAPPFLYPGERPALPLGDAFVELAAGLALPGELDVGPGFGRAAAALAPS